MYDDVAMLRCAASLLTIPRNAGYFRLMNHYIFFQGFTSPVKTIDVTSNLIDMFDLELILRSKNMEIHHPKGGLG